MPIKSHDSLRLLSFFLLGSSAWILVNGIYAEIPIIVAALNYDYSVISRITLAITLSNMCPVAYSAVADFRGSKTTMTTTTHVGIGVVLLLGLATSLALSLSDAALQETTLLMSSVCAGIVGTMSLVLLFPHASARVDQTTSLASGTAIANLFVAVLAIVQFGGDEEELFSIEVYFGILTAIFVLSIVGFVGTLRFQKEEKTITSSRGIEVANEDEKDKNIECANVLDDKPTTLRGELEEQPRYHTLDTPHSNNKDEEGASTEGAGEVSTKKSFWSSFIAMTVEHEHINAAQFLLNALVFFLPGVAPFSVQSFPDPQAALHYLTVAQLIAQTLGIIASGKWQYPRVWIQLMAVTVFWIPTVILSVVNSGTAFHTVQSNAALPIAMVAMVNLLYGYSSTTFFHLVTATSRQGEQHIAARVLGTWNQVGALLGSLVGYFLVQYKVIG